MTMSQQPTPVLWGHLLLRRLVLPLASPQLGLPWALLLLLALVLTPATVVLAGSVDWQEVPATPEGRQWWDAGSLRLSRDGNLMVLSRFQPTTTANGQPRPGELYVMEVNCGERLFRDTSVNGIPRFRPEWIVPADDGLLTAVIEASCQAGRGLMQAG